jgi:shikimate kinase
MARAAFDAKPVTPPRRTNLYLVGFMGTGKTTVGRMVAGRLGYEFVDSDHAIERMSGRTIVDIFAREGEAAFRALEHAFILGGHPAEGAVVACGGGLIVPPGMLELVQSRGVIVCLHASLRTILQRTATNRARPLLAVEDPEARIRDLFAEREPIYRRAGTTILTEGRPLAEIVSHVLRVYQREVREAAR